MKAKNLYLPEDVIKFVNKESIAVSRGFSNYIVMLVRAEMEKRQYFTRQKTPHMMKMTEQEDIDYRKECLQEKNE